MTNFLGQIAARTLGSASVAQPLIGPRFGNRTGRRTGSHTGNIAQSGVNSPRLATRRAALQSWRQLAVAAPVTEPAVGIATESAAIGWKPIMPALSRPYGRRAFFGQDTVRRQGPSEERFQPLPLAARLPDSAPFKESSAPESERTSPGLSPMSEPRETTESPATSSLSPSPRNSPPQRVIPSLVTGSTSDSASNDNYNISEKGAAENRPIAAADTFSGADASTGADDSLKEALRQRPPTLPNVQSPNSQSPESSGLHPAQAITPDVEKPFPSSSNRSAAATSDSIDSSPVSESLYESAFSATSSAEISSFGNATSTDNNSLTPAAEIKPTALKQNDVSLSIDNPQKPSPAQNSRASSAIEPKAKLSPNPRAFTPLVSSSSPVQESLNQPPSNDAFTSPTEPSLRTSETLTATAKPSTLSEDSGRLSQITGSSLEPVHKPSAPLPRQSVKRETATNPIAIPPPTINITIGRIDVRAKKPQTASPGHKSNRQSGRVQPALSLDAYLQQRQGGEP